MMLRLFLLGTALLAAPLPAFAQAAPAATASPADPARVAAARPVVEKLFPVGTYKRIMGQSLTKMMDSMMGGMMDMPISAFGRIGGIPEDKLAAMDKTSLGEAMAIIDPYFRERTKRSMDAMMGSMVDLMSSYEPRVREGLTRAYARRFDTRQLGELNAFFSTPTGSAYAADSMTLFMDPEIMAEMQSVMPDLMKKLPDYIAAAQKATDSLPKPRKFKDLSPQERDKFAAIFGVKPSELHDNATPSTEVTK